MQLAIERKKLDQKEEKASNIFIGFSKREVMIPIEAGSSMAGFKVTVQVILNGKDVEGVGADAGEITAIHNAVRNCFKERNIPDYFCSWEHNPGEGDSSFIFRLCRGSDNKGEEIARVAYQFSSEQEEQETAARFLFESYLRILKVI